MSDITCILERAQAGDPSAADELLPLVYEELRRLAAAKMSNEAAGQTLQPTALVLEAWLRLIGNQSQQWNGRAHIFGAVAEAMRRIQVETGRRKRAARHGGGQAKLDLHKIELAAPAPNDECSRIGQNFRCPSAHTAARPAGVAFWCARRGRLHVMIRSFPVAT